MIKSVTFNFDHLIKEINITNTDTAAADIRAGVVMTIKEAMNEVKLNEGDMITFNIGKLVETLNIKTPEDYKDIKEKVQQVLLDAVKEFGTAKRIINNNDSKCN